MSETDLDLSKAPLLSHLLELRRRLLLCLLIFVIIFSGCYYIVEDIYHFLLKPLAQAFDNSEDRRLIYTGLHEAFFTYLKLAFFAATCFTLPLALVQIWQFIAPGLYKAERKAATFLFVMTPLLFATGAALAFYIVMPLAWEFFISFESTGESTGLSVELEARVSEYLSLVIQLILAFGLSFELPILLLLLAKIGMITAQSLSQFRRYAIVITFLIAAFITPPDLISQIALGTPILLLYELSILLIRWTSADEKASERLSAGQY